MKAGKERELHGGSFVKVSLAPRVDDEKGTKKSEKVMRKSQAAGLLYLISHHTAISLPAVCLVRMAKHCSVHWQTFVCFGIMLSSRNISRKAQTGAPLFLCTDTIMPLSLILIILTKSVIKKKKKKCLVWFLFFFFFPYRNVWLQLRYES